MRIDTVQDTIDILSETIKNTYNNNGSEINSLISLLIIEPAKLSEQKNISIEIKLILNSLQIIDKRLTEIERKDKTIVLKLVKE